MSQPTGEFALIEWIRQQSSSTDNVLVGPGDDTAVLRPSEQGTTLVTTDMLLEGSCFLLEEAGPFRVGCKSMAVNLSDIAAMAGRPQFAVVSVGLPRKGGRGIAEELYRGMKKVADQFSTTIVGGDTNTWDGPLVVSVTVHGQSTGNGAVLRSGARVGDWIFTTGPLGGSILGKHLDFTPRVHEAMALHAAVPLHAMIDISDGLAQDLWHICTESNCGAVLFADRIPLTTAAKEMPGSDKPLTHALHDGEDFELIFSVAPEQGESLLAKPPAGVEVFHIGEHVTSGLWLQAGDRRDPLEPRGYSHALH